MKAPDDVTLAVIAIHCIRKNGSEVATKADKRLRVEVVVAEITSRIDTVERSTDGRLKSVDRQKHQTSR